MKPQLTIQDFPGVHNSDLDATGARLLRNGSYKRQRTIMVIPAVCAIPPKVVMSWINLGFPPNNGVIRMLCEGMEVGEAYSAALESILAHPELSQWEFMLTIESDNIPPPGGVIDLIADLENNPQLSAVGGLYFTKGPGGVAQIWGDPRDPIINFRPQVPVPNAIQECCGTGMGFTLYRLSMFRDTRLRRPWFKTLKGSEGFATQDLYFWGDARKYGYTCAIDTRVKVGHYDYEGSCGVPDMVW